MSVGHGRVALGMLLGCQPCAPSLWAPLIVRRCIRMETVAEQGRLLVGIGMRCQPWMELEEGRILVTEPLSSHTCLEVA